MKRTGGKECEAREEYRPVREGSRFVTPSSSEVSLQEAPPTAVMSEAERYISGPQAQGRKTLSTAAVV